MRASDETTHETIDTIAVQTHGRYVLRAQPSPRLLVGFHGYGESAETQFGRLVAVAGTTPWSLLSIQGLHRFYERRTDRVVASWMTRQDRDLAIADNLAYVARVLERVSVDWSAIRSVVFAGFSQGVAMAFRAAVNSAGSGGRHCHVIAVGGDVPPELDAHALGRLSSVLLCRNADDSWYTESRFQGDIERLAAVPTVVQAVTVAGGHAWSTDVSEAAGRYANTYVVSAETR